ncbi:MAG: tetratricopeptide repeat protein [Phycisphaerales bacterium]|jgi:tetratricopeptide (TPR) repeat protein|nr:tetratricopeptide repeat protein [Phycisphaerales bacterium]
MTQSKKTSANISPSKGKASAGRCWRLRTKLLVMFCSVAISLVCCEIAVRLIGHAPEIIPIGVNSNKNVYRRSTNPILSYEFKPGYRSNDTDLAHDYRKINSHGLRDIEREFAKPAGTKRILLLGDSVVVGYRIKEIDQLMSRQLEMLYGDQKVEVLNMAVTGYCTRAEVELLRVRGLKYDPDVVIMVFVENDFRNFNPESIGADGVVNRPAAASWLFDKSHLFRLACLQFNWFNFGLETDPASWNHNAIGDNNVPEGLALLRALADEYGFNPLVVVWPAFTHDNIEYPKKMFMPDSDELIIERLARGYNIPVVGLREAFGEHWKAQSPRPIARDYYSVGDEMHASVEGHRVAAEILHRIIREHGLLDSTRHKATQAKTVSQDNAALQAAKALGSEKAGYGLVHINKAVTLYKKGKLDDAVEQLEKVEPGDLKNYGEANVIIASILDRQGNFAKAKARLLKLLETNPKIFHAHMLLASFLNRERAYEKAIEHMRLAVALKPDTYAGRYGLGMALARRGRWKEAEPHLRAAVRLNQNSTTSKQLLARCMRELKN